MAVKKADLIPTVLKDGQIVLDITDGFLNPPAIITFYRDRSFSASMVPINYIFNNKDIIKIGNGKSASFTTTSAVNTFTTKETQKDFDDTALIEFVARPGEHISIHYKSFQFEQIQRH